MQMVGAFLLLALAFSYLDRASLLTSQATMEAFSACLVGKLIVLDPGHGGPDPGVVRDGVREKDLTLAVAQRLACFLRQAGAEVVLTREDDRDLADADLWELRKRKRQDLERRIALANQLRADAFLSIHVNSFAEADEYGPQVFYQSGSAESMELAQAIQDEIKYLLRNTERLPRPGDYLVGRQARMPAVVVEVGFLTHPEERERLQDPVYQSQLAFAIGAGVLRFFKQAR
ncbi:N-acetylmuramoyl-L-alanine amidase [Desulfothermobacter acidiphilus]|uniref:N-acetylmuramoyl-L-alanine amidase n=1 Tax=Desulfothermobacter acidiphilus TaxID=1938353 RepID=UPI003F88848E